MEIVKANKSNLASVIMGKNIQFPWRGQKDVLISVPFDEWLAFIEENKNLISYRVPLDYNKMLSTNDEGIKIRFFMYEISWALYCELANSSNVRKDATLILPYFDNGKSIMIDEVIRTIDQTASEELAKYHNKLKAATRNYYALMGDCDLQYGLVDVSKLSAWNMFIYKLCLFLQSKSSNKTVTERLNIDWRIT